MNHTGHFIHYKGYHLFYRTYGSGSKALLAFHGFGSTGEDWYVFEKQLGDEFTIYAFDIFYHGESYIDETIEPYISKEFWIELIERFMRELKISRISLLGYSLGSKLVFCMVELMSGYIDNVFVIAPDGLKISFWSRFVSQTIVGDVLFKQVIKNPGIVFSLSGLLKRTGMLHEKMDSFIRIQLSDSKKRKQVYNVWILLRDMVPEKRRVQKHIFRYSINYQMFFGKYDAIIPLKLGEEFSKGIKKKTLHVLDCGHQMSGVTFEICGIIKNSLK